MTTREYVERFLEALSNPLQFKPDDGPPELLNFYPEFRDAGFVLELLRMHASLDPDSSRTDALEHRLASLEGDFALLNMSRKK